MRRINHLVAAITAYALFGTCILPPLEARTKKGDRFLTQGRRAENTRSWDEALENYEKALAEDPGDSAYQLAAQRVRFQAAAAHITVGQKLRNQGSLVNALAEFQKAYSIDPSSTMAEQEIRRTQQMIQREKAKEEGKPAEDASAEANVSEPPMTPAEAAKKASLDRLSKLLPVPELRPLNTQLINLRINNQPPKTLFETVGKFAGVNVLFDPDYSTGQPVKNQNIEITNASLEEALDYLSVVTKSFWKPLSPNTIFVTQDNTTKRRDYEEQVMKVFYLTNVQQPQEIQEIITAIRSVADIQRIFAYNTQFAIIIRGEADRVALAEQIINDLDKPRSEVLVDVIVMEANAQTTRKLAAAISPGGLNMPISFTPRTSLATPAKTTTSDTGDQTSTSTTIPLSNLPKIGTKDFSTTVPGALLEAILTDNATRVLQSPQIRAVDNQKASLKIGSRQPTATGSFQPGIGVAGAGVSALVNTQFTFIDVGVNVDMVPKVHDNGEISLHIEVEISNVASRISIGGIDQPVIGQRKISQDIRVRDGEVNLVGGLIEADDTKQVTGIPILSSIPILKRLFSTEEVTKTRNELLIALRPHIMRKPELTPLNLRGIAVGNATVVKLNYAARKPDEKAPPATAPQGVVTSPAPVTTPAQPPATAPRPAPPATAPPEPPPATAPPPQPTPTVGGQVSFLPNVIDTNLSGSFTVNLMVNNAQDAFAAPMEINFDPKMLRLNDVTQGNLLTQDAQQPAFTKNILNDAGRATVSLNRLGGTGGVNGSGSLVTLVFQAVGRGTTTVTIPNLTVRNSSLQPIVGPTSPTMTVNVK